MEFCIINKIRDMYMDIEYETKRVFFHVRNVSIYIIYGKLYIWTIDMNIKRNNR